MPSATSAPSPAPRSPIAGLIQRSVRPLLCAIVAAYLMFRLFWLNEFLVHVDDFVPFAELLRQNGNPWFWRDIVHLSGFYTYPPGQFFLSFPLAALADDFDRALFLYRLPSLLFWCGGLWLLFHLVRELWPELPVTTAWLPVGIGLLSWRGFIESSQGYNYATTTGVVVIVAWFVSTARGRAWISRGAGSALGAGLLLGLLTWFTYQALFVVAAGLAALFLSHLWQRDFRAMALACVAGAGFTLPFGAVYWLCLRHAMQWASGTPAWAGGIPPADLLGKLTFPFRAWFEVAQNNLSVVGWGAASAVLTAIAVVVIFAGLWRLMRRAGGWQSQRPLLIFLGVIGLEFSLGPYLKLFPLGASRHSFVLQVPLLLLVALALAELRPSARVIGISSVVLLGSWLWSLPSQLDAVRSRVDFPLIESQFRRWPDTRIADLPGAFTWEITYLAREDLSRLERIRWYLQFGNTSELAGWLMEAPRALLVSHRGPMGPEFMKELKTAGARHISPLAEQSPGRGSELKGPLNGGNGFYLYLIER